jgi:hypothetical protein
MTHHERALEAAARAVVNQWKIAESDMAAFTPNAIARAAVTAYQAAMPPPVSPELIAGLNKLATYLTEQGEYEAVDLIDTVVARLTPLPAPPAAQEKK